LTKVWEGDSELVDELAHYCAEACCSEASGEDTEGLVGGRLAESEFFADRDKELADLLTVIRDSVTTNKIENAVVCGERGFGKTSLLVKLVEERPVGCFSSFRALSAPESPAEFAEATIQKMNRVP
jgi:hypothetical protein